MKPPPELLKVFLVSVWAVSTSTATANDGAKWLISVPVLGIVRHFWTRESNLKLTWQYKCDLGVASVCSERCVMSAAREGDMGDIVEHMQGAKVPRSN